MPRWLSLFLAISVPLTATSLLFSQTETVPSPQRIRLFRIQPGFLAEIPWLEEPVAEPEPDPDPGPDWLALSIGSDNPHFELRRNGDPGGVGFARVYTQVQLWESGRTALSVGMQAFAPMGLESDGLADQDGPTVVSPALSLFYSLDEGLALQAFVGKNVPLMNSSARPVRREVQYGVAFQQAISTESSDPLSSLFVTIGALGLGDRSGRRVSAWEVLPGLHWQPGESWWMTAGYAFPVRGARGELAPQWQVTCSWQY